MNSFFFLGFVACLSSVFTAIHALHFGLPMNHLMLRPSAKQYYNWPGVPVLTVYHVKRSSNKDWPRGVCSYFLRSCRQPLIFRVHCPFLLGRRRALLLCSCDLDRFWSAGSRILAWHLVLLERWQRRRWRRYTIKQTQRLLLGDWCRLLTKRL